MLVRENLTGVFLRKAALTADFEGLFSKFAFVLSHQRLPLIANHHDDPSTMPQTAVSSSRFISRRPRHFHGEITDRKLVLYRRSQLFSRWAPLVRSSRSEHPDYKANLWETFRRACFRQARSEAGANHLGEHDLGT